MAAMRPFFSCCRSGLPGRGLAPKTSDYFTEWADLEDSCKLLINRVRILREGWAERPAVGILYEACW